METDFGPFANLTAVLNVQSVCLTLQSMLASCKVRLSHPSATHTLFLPISDSIFCVLCNAPSQKKEWPQGNDEYVKRAPKSPKDARFVYDVSPPFQIQSFRTIRRTSKR